MKQNHLHIKLNEAIVANDDSHIILFYLIYLFTVDCLSVMELPHTVAIYTYIDLIEFG